MKRILLVLLLLVVVSCSKEKENPEYDPIFIWDIEYTITSEEFSRWNVPGQEPYYVAFHELDESDKSNFPVEDKVYVNGKLSTEDSHAKNGDLIVYDSHQFRYYINDILAGDVDYIKDVSLKDNSQGNISIELSLKRQPVAGEIFKIRVELWNHKWGYYI